jgi:hypothetical protein
VYAATVSPALAHQVRIHSLDPAGEPNMAFSDDGFASPSLPYAPLLLSLTHSGDRLFVVSARGAATVDLYAIALT